MRKNIISLAIVVTIGLTGLYVANEWPNHFPETASTQKPTQNVTQSDNANDGLGLALVIQAASR